MIFTVISLDLLTWLVGMDHTFKNIFLLFRLVASQDFLGMEEGMDHNNMYQIRGLKMLYEGDGYAKLNKVRK